MFKRAEGRYKHGHLWQCYFKQNVLVNCNRSLRSILNISSLVGRVLARFKRGSFRVCVPVGSCACVSSVTIAHGFSLSLCKRRNLNIERFFSALYIENKLMGFEVLH